MSNFGEEGEAAGKASAGSFSSCRGCAVIENWRQSSVLWHGILHFVQDDTLFVILSVSEESLG